MEHLYTLLLTKAEIEELRRCISTAESEGMGNELAEIVATKLDDVLRDEKALTA